MSFLNKKEKIIHVERLNLNIRAVITFADYPRANLIIVHGLGERLEKYDRLTSFMVEKGYNVIRYDQPGHGKSGGERGYINSIDDLTETLNAVVNRVKQSSYYFPIFAIGHSMGGETVLTYLTQHPQTLDASIVTDPYSVYETELFGKFPLDLPSHSVIKNDTNGGGVNRDLRVAQRAAKDPGDLKEIKAGLMNALYEGALSLRKSLPKIVDPIFIMHGESDGIFSYTDSFKAYQLISSKDKEIHVYPFIMHSLLVDPQRQSEIYEEIDRWLSRHIY